MMTEEEKLLLKVALKNHVNNLYIASGRLKTNKKLIEAHRNAEEMAAKIYKRLTGENIYVGEMG